MSDFFGDDFTIELKEYFLNQLLGELQKFSEASDEESWSVFRDEIQEKSAEWIVDANTNEFTFFSLWFQAGVEASLAEDFHFFGHFLVQSQEYLQKLLVTKKDSEELKQSFAIQATRQGSLLYLHCQIAEQDIVLPVQNILEVTSGKKISPLPQVMPGIRGMIPYRGEAIPVFDLLDATSAITADNYVVCEVDRQIFALRVSSVDQLFEIQMQELQEKGARENLFQAPFITHFVTRENKNMFVFDLQRLVVAA